MGNMIIKFYTQSEPGGLLSRIGCKAFTDDEINALSFQSKAPIYIAQATVGSLGQAEQWLRNQASSRQNIGPFYTLLANAGLVENASSMNVIFFAPSWTKDGRKCPNHTSIANCHSWMERLLGSPQYSADGAESCNRPCAGSYRQVSTYSKRRSLFFVDNYRDIRFNMPCGCEGGCQNTPHPYNAKNSKKYPARSRFFYAYRVNIGPASALARNILPGGDQLTTSEGRTSITSLNGSYTLRLSGANVAVNGTVIKSLPGRAVRLEFSNSGEMTLSHAAPGTGNEEIFLTIQVALEKSESPLALVIENDGQLNAYDRFNKVVTAPALRAMSSAITGMPSEYLDGEGLDLLNEYQRRLRNLLAYLRFYGLLTEYKGTIDLKSPGFKALVTGNAGEIDDPASEPFDPKANYIDRLRRLQDYLANSAA